MDNEEKELHDQRTRLYDQLITLMDKTYKYGVIAALMIGICIGSIAVGLSFLVTDSARAFHKVIHAVRDTTHQE